MLMLTNLKNIDYQIYTYFEYMLDTTERKDMYMNLLSFSDSLYETFHYNKRPLEENNCYMCHILLTKYSSLYNSLSTFKRMRIMTHISTMKAIYSKHNDIASVRNNVKELAKL